MTVNSVEKCFVVRNVIQNILLTLKPNLYCFCLEHHYQHGLFCLKYLHIVAYNLPTETESLKPCIQLFLPIKMTFFGLFFFRTSRSVGEFPNGYLINIATCLFAYH